MRQAACVSEVDNIPPNAENLAGVRVALRLALVIVYAFRVHGIQICASSHILIKFHDKIISLFLDLSPYS